MYIQSTCNIHVSDSDHHIRQIFRPENPDISRFLNRPIVVDFV